MPRETGAQRRRRNGATVLFLVSVVAGMTGLSFASVPLYRLFCQATGLGGWMEPRQAMGRT